MILARKMDLSFFYIKYVYNHVSEQNISYNLKLV